MKISTIVIIVLSILLVGAVIFAIMVSMKLKKERASHANPADDVQRFINTLPIYASNADALENGLKVGDKYRTSSTATNFTEVQAAI